MKTNRYEEMKNYIANYNTRSAWSRGVTKYALELLDELFENITNGYFDIKDIDNRELLRKQLLNGSTDWKDYSYKGCALAYDSDIAERLCTPSELKKTKNGQRRPNSREEWLDTQARALYQAYTVVQYAARMTA